MNIYEPLVGEHVTVVLPLSTLPTESYTQTHILSGILELAEGHVIMIRLPDKSTAIFDTRNVLGLIQNLPVQPIDNNDGTETQDH